MGTTEDCIDFDGRKFNYKDVVEFEYNERIWKGQIIGYENNLYRIKVYGRRNTYTYYLINQDDIITTTKMEPEAPYGVSYVASAPNEDEPSNVYRFRTIVNKMAETYNAKNADYGDSFGKSIEKYGAIAGLTRISDKFNRLENLILKKEQKVSDEKIGDTLLDLANYAIMLYMAMNCDISDVEFENK